MTPKKSLLYTRTGDRGTTALIGGSRAPKNSVRVCAYGDVDELNSWIGMVEAQCTASGLSLPDGGVLSWASHRLFDIGAYLADPSAPASPVDDADISRLERGIDTLDSLTAPMRSFVLPGGSLPAASAHVARTVCRRAERSILTLADSGAEVAPTLISFVNRLSDYLFALARWTNQALSVPDTPWLPK